MKKTYILISILSIILFCCCNSSDNIQNLEIEYIDLSPSIVQNQTLEISLGPFLSEGNTYITKQAKHYVISEITFNETGLVYNYKPNASFSGTENVEITKSSSIGDDNINQKTIFRINIKVD
ncbi:hypothetical protein [Yeosuana sp. AK3]